MPKKSNKPKSRVLLDRPLSWLEFSENGIDIAVLLEGVISDTVSLAGHASASLDVIYYGLSRGIRKAGERDLAQRAAKDREALSKDVCEKAESLIEKNLKRHSAAAWTKAKKDFTQTYETKKKSIEETKLLSTDIPERILSYDVGGYNVLESVVQKHLNDPHSSESRKLPIRALSDALDEFKSYSQAGTAELLSKLSLASEKVGSSLYESSMSMLSEEALELAGLSALAQRVMKKNLAVVDSVFSGEQPILSYITTTAAGPVAWLAKTKKHRFALAGLYDGLKTPQKPPQKTHRKPNAQKRYDEKIQRRKTVDVYGSYTPSFLDTLKHKSGWNEWRSAYDIVKESYEKTDEKVDKGMDSLLLKSTLKATSQENLELRNALKHHEPELHRAFSYYDQIRAVSTASHMWLDANIYRSSRYLGSAARKAAEWLSSGSASSLQGDQAFQAAAEGLKSAKFTKKPRQHPAAKGKHTKQHQRKGFKR